MKTIKNSWLNSVSLSAPFFAMLTVALCLTACVSTKKPAVPLAEIHKLTNNISIQQQPEKEHLLQLKAQGYTTIISLRPDGESADQPSSKEMADIAAANNMKFYYVPVKPGNISEQSVEQLAQALKESPGPVLMYCKSGSRAARTWSLVEASKPDGMDAKSILSTVKSAGKSADDLSERIMEKIAQRKPATK